MVHCAWALRHFRDSGSGQDFPPAFGNLTDVLTVVATKQTTIHATD